MESAGNRNAVQLLESFIVGSNLVIKIPFNSLIMSLLADAME